MVSRLTASVSEGSVDLRIGGHGQIHFLEALEILVIALEIEIASGDADQLGVASRDRLRAAVQLIAIIVHGAPEIFDVQPENHIRVCDQPAAARV